MSPEEVGAQLERVLSSPQFSQSARLSSFLRYVVEAVQSGQADSLKEYAIGVEVFERGESFDPRIDNIVRIQAGKLRSRLAEYYAAGGASDPIVIGMPKGGYVPELRRRDTTPPAPAPGSSPSSAAMRTRIAVLPFVNMSSDAENEYFSDGLTEEVINRLAGVPTLQVVARTSVFSFKGRNEDVRHIGVKLNVGTVLEGSVRKAGDQLRVTAQLIDVESGFHLFSRTYDREFKDVFELQDELAATVAGEIAPDQTGSRAAQAVAARTSNLDAYNAYLRGMFAMSSRFSDLDGCIERFREALHLDPSYAPAWAGMAHGYFLLAWFYRSAAGVVMPLSKEAARKSLALDPDSAPALHSLATAECALEWQWSRAEERFRRAIALQPSLSIGYIEFALFCLVPQLRNGEAREIVERGLSVDPFNPLLHALAVHLHGRLGRYDEALAHYATAISIAPKYPPIRVAAGMAHEWNGELEQALVAYGEACELSRNAPYPLSCLGHAAARLGDEGKARTILNQLEADPLVSASDLARIHCGLRDADRTLQYLETDARSKCLHLLRVTGDPRFDWLASEPRFRSILRKMGLPSPAGVNA